jgi:S1-C subfamily serine protease
VKPRTPNWKVVAAVAGGAIFGFVLAAATVGFGTVDSDAGRPTAILARSGAEPYTDAEARRIDTIQRVKPSVVNISTKAIQERYFWGNPLEVPRGTGTGFVWDKNGHIVTNYHVIMDADIAEVTLDGDSSPYKAKLVGAYPEKDIAVLKIDAPAGKLRAVELGDSTSLKVGQTVLAIGNPFGYDSSVTEGIISALGREILSVAKTIIIDVIQTDAAINPGNSGGPLVDSSGRVIGVNVAIFSPSQASIGIGFAIPVDIVKNIAGQIIEYGEVRTAIHPVLGIEAFPDRQVARAGLRGVVIHKIFAGSGAESAGLRPYKEKGNGGPEYDVIVAVDGQEVNRLADLTYVLEKRKVGDEVELTVYRGGRTVKLKAKLGKP